MVIRPETPADYSQIADITYEAFSAWKPRPFRAEPTLVDAMRSGQFYDPELSLVAEEEETHRVIGHALFSFLPSILLGQEKKGAYLAPLTVAPTHQRQGVGSALMAEGARIAREKGIAFILLCGHPDYYIRHGYQPQAFSLTGCTVTLEPGTQAPAFIERPVRQSDLPWLTRRWKELHLTDRLALYPGDLIGQWMSHSPLSRSSVFLTPETDEIAGYVRYIPQSAEIHDFVPMPHQAESLLRFLSSTSSAALPLPAQTARELGLAAAEHVTSSDAYFMLNVAGDSVVNEYLQSREPGIVVFPSVLDLDT